MPERDPGRGHRGGSRQSRTRGGLDSDGGGEVVWTDGRLFALAPPEDVAPAWSERNAAALPLLPNPMRLVAKPRRDEKIASIKSSRSVADTVVIATNPDEEGETAAREVLEQAGFVGHVLRLWLRSLNPGDIQTALSSVFDAKRTEGLWLEARAREWCGWIVGANLTRALTCRLNGRRPFPVGYVLTQALAIANRIAFHPGKKYRISAIVSWVCHIEGMSCGEYREYDEDVSLELFHEQPIYATTGFSRAPNWSESPKKASVAPFT
ncbi:MAG: toprim domain-containing protein [Chthoniobacteraceae bacterium]